MNPHDRRDVRKTQEQLKAEAREQDEFLRQMLSFRQGRNYFWALLGSCGIAHNPFRPDALSMAFEAGKMNVGQQILADIIRVAPDRYVEMMGEQNERRDRDSSDGANTSSDGSDDNQHNLFGNPGST